MRWVVGFFLWMSVVLSSTVSADTAGDLQRCTEKTDPSLYRQAIEACARVVQAYGADKSAPNYALALRSKSEKMFWLLEPRPPLPDLNNPRAVEFWNNHHEQIEAHDKLIAKMHKDEAIRDISEVIALHPNDSDALSTRALWYSELGNHDDAIADRTAVIRLKPNDPAAYFVRGLEFAEMHSPSAAIADFEKAIALLPDAPEGRERAFRGLYRERDKAYAALGKAAPELSPPSVASVGELAKPGWAWVIGGPLMLVGFTVLVGLFGKISRYELLRISYSVAVAAVALGVLWFREIYPGNPRGPQEAADWAAHPYASLLGAAIPCLLIAPLFYWWLGKAKWFDRMFAKPAPIVGEPWWQVLGVPSDATLDQVKTAYSALLEAHRPDRVSTMGKDIQELAEKKTKEIDGAYIAALTQLNKG